MSFKRYVALGDSFTEGVGDNDPTRPNGLRGWADRVAEALAAADPEFRYANLAIRGRKLPQIIDEQVEPALALRPDLITIHGGGNDVLRPKVDIDHLAQRYDAAIERLAASGAKVVMFTLFDPGSYGIYSAMRGRMALFNEWVREIADARDVTLVDQWRMRDVDLVTHLDPDRMHLNSHGHHYMAIQVLDALGLPHDLVRDDVPPAPVLTRKEALAENARWTREFLGPWIHRRLTGRSSGDSVSPKHPALERIG
ncbi:SGNH/GDSL hydrolase family protein [Nocardioides jishulii]|uniref:SGNH/GDSL hydrolase family protein n=1 Tax=Nocardioides jishulii TaxID=2575440 RepID=A0A4V5TM12_9ACTN|nr:SGNH/GDSL hydrolase family protein [Nocardioides jishulii]QCX26312.1 SGNH/GDSL hydrolase family protein [Nocardioides jishulii]TKI63883.1 SGNH/GDSL hydrolase family protein [Nocardioides jishulii]